MICYEVITRQSVYGDYQGNKNLLQKLIADGGQKPNMYSIKAVEKELSEQNSKNFEIFEILKTTMEKCWCFNPLDRLSINEVSEKLSEFAGSDNSFKNELKIHTEGIAKSLVRYKKHSITLEIKKSTSSRTKQIKTSEAKVPLNKLLPPFFHSA